MSTSPAPEARPPSVAAAADPTTRRSARPRARGRGLPRGRARRSARCVFLFPFYYMVIGSLQTDARPDGGRRVPRPGEPHPRQLRRRSTSASTCSQALLNSGHLHRRRAALHRRLRRAGGLRPRDAAVARPRRRCSRSRCWCRSCRSSCCMIPLYVLIARDYGLADTLPGHDPAVRDQLDGGDHLPAVLPAAAQGAVRGRPDRRRRRAAHAVEHRAAAGAPGAADGRAAHLHRPVERVPLAVPDHQGRRRCSRSRCPSPTTSPPSRRRPPTRSARSWPAPSCWRSPPSCSSSCSSGTSSRRDLGSGVKG